MFVQRVRKGQNCIRGHILCLRYLKQNETEHNFDFTKRGGRNFFDSFHFESNTTIDLYPFHIHMQIILNPIVESLSNLRCKSEH